MNLRLLCIATSACMMLSITQLSYTADVSSRAASQLKTKFYEALNNNDIKSAQSILNSLQQEGPIKKNYRQRLLQEFEQALKKRQAAPAAPRPAAKKPAPKKQPVVKGRKPAPRRVAQKPVAQAKPKPQQRRAPSPSRRAGQPAKPARRPSPMPAGRLSPAEQKARAARRPSAGDEKRMQAEMSQALEASFAEQQRDRERAEIERRQLAQAIAEDADLQRAVEQVRAAQQAESKRSSAEAVPVSGDEAQRLIQQALQQAAQQRRAQGEAESEEEAASLARAREERLRELQQQAEQPGETPQGERTQPQLTQAQREALERSQRLLVGNPSLDDLRYLKANDPSYRDILKQLTVQQIGALQEFLRPTDPIYQDLQAARPQGKYAAEQRAQEAIAAQAAPLSVHAAATRGDVNGIKAALRAGMGLDTPDEQGMTPLMLAAQNNHLSAVKFLIKSGADVTRKNYADQTTLDLAGPLVRGYLQGLPQGKRLLKLTKDADGQLLQAVENNDLELLQAALQAQADVNAVDAQGQTALHIAAKKGNAQLAVVLLDAGANINAIDDQGNTPIGVAIGKAQELLQRRISAAVDFMEAIRNDDLQKVLTLLTTANQREALIAAAEYNKPAIVVALLDSGKVTSDDVQAAINILSPTNLEHQRLKALMNANREVLVAREQGAPYATVKGLIDIYYLSKLPFMEEGSIPRDVRTAQLQSTQPREAQITPRPAGSGELISQVGEEVMQAIEQEERNLQALFSQVLPYLTRKERDMYAAYIADSPIQQRIKWLQERQKERAQFASSLPLNNANADSSYLMYKEQFEALQDQGLANQYARTLFDWIALPDAELRAEALDKLEKAQSQRESKYDAATTAQATAEREQADHKALIERQQADDAEFQAQLAREKEQKTKEHEERQAQERKLEEARIQADREAQEAEDALREAEEEKQQAADAQAKAEEEQQQAEQAQEEVAELSIEIGGEQEEAPSSLLLPRSPAVDEPESPTSYMAPAFVPVEGVVKPTTPTTAPTTSDAGDTKRAAAETATSATSSSPTETKRGAASAGERSAFNNQQKQIIHGLIESMTQDNIAETERQIVAILDTLGDSPAAKEIREKTATAKEEKKSSF